MAWQLAETIADATAAYIAASQTAKLADVQARFTTIPITLGDFAAVRFSDPFIPREPEYPILYIAPDTTEIEYGAGHTALDGVHVFEFAVLVRHAGDITTRPAEMVKRASARYILAVLEMLNDMHTHSSSTYYANGAPVHWGSNDIAPRIYYQPTYSRQSGEYIGDARLIIGCSHTEV